MRIHELKTWPEPFEAVLDGRKCYEIRRDDRGYAVGDVLHLREWHPCDCDDYEVPRAGCDGGAYTGREAFRTVTYLTPGGAWGLPADLCVMSIVDEADPPGSDDIAAPAGEGEVQR